MGQYSVTVYLLIRFICKIPSRKVHKAVSVNYAKKKVVSVFFLRSIVVV